MKILVRILLCLLVLCLLGGLAAALGMVADVPWLSAQVAALMGAYSWLATALAVVLLFFGALCVLALVLLVSVPVKRRRYVVNQGLGRIEITRQSIESAAAACLDEIQAVKRYHVRTGGPLRPRKLRLEAEIEPREANIDLLELGKSIQQRLAQDMACSLEIDPKHVQVAITTVHRPWQQEAEHNHGKVPRVV